MIIYHGKKLRIRGELILLSASKRAAIVTQSEKDVEEIRDQAAAMKQKIPEPLLYSEYLQRIKERPIKAVFENFDTYMDVWLGEIIAMSFHNEFKERECLELAVPISYIRYLLENRRSIVSSIISGRRVLANRETELETIEAVAFGSGHRDNSGGSGGVSDKAYVIPDIVRQEQRRSREELSRLRAIVDRKEQDIENLLAYIFDLPAPEQDCIIKGYYDNLDWGIMADQTGEHINTIYKRRDKAIRTIAKRWVSDGRVCDHYEETNKRCNK